ncbi:aminoacyl-tRNA hydrolase [Candidatus Berkelbacteria bacterium]|nr:aminoacyl-tRNA hydrolase [Candidatus Berkelbacteria bacterium]
MKIIVGLGNPDIFYERTRHNIGWLALDVLRKQLVLEPDWQVSEWAESEKFEAFIAEAHFKKEKVLLIKPTTFMNNSGRSVERIRAFYRLAPEQILAVYDELAVSLGSIRIRFGGQTAGHNGVGSLIHHLGTENFWRARIGIAPLDQSLVQTDMTQFVLSQFTTVEKMTIHEAIDSTVKFLIKSLIESELEETTLKVVEARNPSV